MRSSEGGADDREVPESVVCQPRPVLAYASDSDPVSDRAIACPGIRPGWAAHNTNGSPAAQAGSPGRAALHTAGGEVPWSSAGPPPDLPRGEDGAGRVRAPRHQHPAGLVPDVVVAPEVAARIVVAHTAGTNLATLAERWHLTLREVAQVVTVWGTTRVRSPN